MAGLFAALLRSRTADRQARHGWAVFRLEGHILDPNCFKVMMLMRQAADLAPILAARPLIARRYPSIPKPRRLANAALAVNE